jgi:hypothetical protein
MRTERWVDASIGWIMPFYDEFKTFLLFWLIASRPIVRYLHDLSLLHSSLPSRKRMLLRAPNPSTPPSPDY